MNSEKNILKTYICRFSNSRAGSNVYLTILKSDMTVHRARSNTDIVEFGGGSFGIDILFEETGSYIFLWDIDTTSLKSVDVVNVGENTTNDIKFIKQINGGRWKIYNNQMIFYAEDNTTVIATFDLFDKNGDANDIDVAERVLV